MPKPRSSTDVLLEGIQSEVKQLADGLSQLREEVQRGFQGLRAEMTGRFTVVEQAIKENSRDIKQLQQAVGENSKDIKSLTERFEEHQKEHAT